MLTNPSLMTLVLTSQFHVYFVYPSFQTLVVLQHYHHQPCLHCPPLTWHPVQELLGEAGGGGAARGVDHLLAAVEVPGDGNSGDNVGVHYSICYSRRISHSRIFHCEAHLWKLQQSTATLSSSSVGVAISPCNVLRLYFCQMFSSNVMFMWYFSSLINVCKCENSLRKCFRQPVMSKFSFSWKQFWFRSGFVEVGKCKIYNCCLGKVDWM